MHRTSVESSVIASLGYSADDRILEVEFRSGRIYQYFEVSAERHQRLMAAESIGRYFNKMIRDRYERRELEAEAE